MNPIEWLGRWEPIEAPGKHTRMYPASFSHGYQYDPHVCRQQGVSRDIPVDGRIGASWERSPQARYWLEKEKPTILERIKRWLKEAA